MFKCGKNCRTVKSRGGAFVKELQHSSRVAMSEGAALINKIISFARGENWRGKKKKTTRRRHTTRRRAATRRRRSRK